MYILSIILMMLFPPVLAALLRRRFEVRWFLFCVGTLTFIFSQVVHFPLNDWLKHLQLLPENQLNNDFPLWRTSLILGLTAGICEELARMAGYFLLSRFRRFEDGTMLALGHGGIESMVFGGAITAGTLSTFIAFNQVDMAAYGMSAEQINYLQGQFSIITSSPLTAFYPLFERLLAMTAHFILSLIVLQAFRKKNWLYVPAAILYHAFIDGVLSYLNFNGWSIPLIHAGFLLTLLPGLLWVFLTWRGKMTPRRVQNGSPLNEIRIYFYALKKELLQQWRSKRLLVVLIVFVAFGLMSPAFAKFTPEILKSVEGAEQFADLIPEPQISDAVVQYIKNLTQFGFILAVLLGMGAVVGEKEKGTAAMILSKPMPRWAFIFSKFSAQFVVYLAAFILSGVGAWYYTWVIFGQLPVGGFALVNVLLFVWLLTFVSLTLFASVLAGSTAAAAGIGLGAAVILLLAGNLPVIGGLAPGALVNWASQVGLGSGGEILIPNGAALCVALVIILMGVLGALAVFETQEI
jgi:ABC-2 type transport system permease protein